MLKKLSLLLLLFLKYASVYAQIDSHPWCPEGATWTYGLTSQMDWRFNVFKYIGDREINGVTCKDIQVKEVSPVLGPPFGQVIGRNEQIIDTIQLRKSNDSIFIFHNNQFRFMYNFNASINDYFIVNNYIDFYLCENPDPEYFIADSIFIESIQTANFEGVDFQVLKTSASSYWTFGDLIKNIGGDVSFFPSSTSSMCSWQSQGGGLICYSDNLRGTILFDQNYQNTNVVNCDFLVSAVIETEKIEIGFTIVPNPAADHVVLTSEMQDQISYQIYDLTGKLVMAEIDVFPNYKIDIANLNSGTYLLRIFSSNKVFTHKILKI